jgi:3-hydroxyacyl-CoA dehydrogenase
MQETLCICGAGTMGSGIALSAAQNGLKVILYDLDPARVPRARLQIEKDLQEQVEKKRIGAGEKEISCKESGSQAQSMNAVPGSSLKPLPRTRKPRLRCLRSWTR